jgi:hypothetical protein
LRPKLANIKSARCPRKPARTLFPDRIFTGVALLDTPEMSYFSRARRAVGDDGSASAKSAWQSEVWNRGRRTLDRQLVTHHRAVLAVVDESVSIGACLKLDLPGPARIPG